MTGYKQVDDRLITSLERHVRPLARILAGAEFTSQDFQSRRAAILEKIEATKLSVKPPSAGAGATDAGGDKPAASGKLLLTQLTKPDALDLLQQLAAYRTSADYDPTTYLEWAHTGRWPAEVRAAKLATAERMPRVTPAEVTARADALAAVAANDALAPVYALMQLAWGHVKALEGYPELQDIYDLGQTHMPDVVGRVCARAFSADGSTVPPALRFARAVKLAAALKGRLWEAELDFCNDGDACMLSYIEGGTGVEIERVPHDMVYADIAQVLRVRRIGASVLAFFGVRDGPTHSWRQMVSTCEHALQSVAASDAVKRQRVGRAMRRLITRALGDVGKRVDLVRYSAKHDVVMTRDLLPAGKGGPMEEFAEAVARISEDQKRKRSAVSDDASAMLNVRLPAECKNLQLAGAQERAPKAQRATPLSAAAAETARPPLRGSDAVPHAPTPGEGKQDGQYTPLTLASKPVQGKPAARITIHVDKPAALRWLSDHGVPRACLGFQFGHAGKSTRRWASCPKQSEASHSETAEGPHQIAAGWDQAAPTFVRPADRHLLSA